MYVGRVCTAQPGPYALLETGEQMPDYAYERTFRFEVAADSTGELAVSIDENPGSLDVRVGVRNLNGEVPRPTWVWAESQDPLFGTQVVAAAKTDEHGTAVLKGLRPGTLTLYAGREEYASTTEGAKLHGLRLPFEDGATIEMIVREYAWDGTETLQRQGRLEITVKNCDLPVEGARLWRESRPESERGRGGWLGPTSGADGKIVFDELWTGEYWFETNHQTCRHFRFDVLPGETTTGMIELCPEGTSVLRGQLDSAGKDLRWAVLHVHADPEVHLPLTVSESGEFTVWDVPPGHHRISVAYDSDQGPGNARLPLDVAEQRETEWHVALASQLVTVDPPAGIERSDKVHVTLKTPHSTVYDAGEYPAYRNTREIELLGVYPGTYQVELRAKNKLWVSGEFSVVDSPITVSDWKIQEEPAPPSAAQELVRLKVGIPEGLPPWSHQLRGHVVVWTGDEPWDSESIDPASTHQPMTATFQAKSRAIEVKIPGCTVFRMERPKDGWPEELSITPETAPSRMICFALPDSGRVHAASLWSTVFRLNGGAWLTIPDPPRRSEIRPDDPVTANITRLVSRSGMPAIWLPNLESGRTVEIRVPGFEEISVDLNPGDTGYRELICELKPKK
jgi:hypothetical protein